MYATTHNYLIAYGLVSDWQQLHSREQSVAADRNGSTPEIRSGNHAQPSFRSVDATTTVVELQGRNG